MFFLCLNLRYTYCKHRGRIHTEEKAKVALLVEEKFLGLHLFWEDARVVVWCGVNQPFFQSIHFAMLFILFFKSSWCKIRPPSISDNLCLLFCIYPSSIIVPICGSTVIPCTAAWTLSLSVSGVSLAVGRMGSPIAGTRGGGQT